MTNAKQAAALEAAKLVKNGMTLGLGTGSTAQYFIAEIGRRIATGALTGLTAITTSSATSAQARAVGIPLESIDDVERVDLTVDGADEVDTRLDGIKGGGGSLLMEKIVAIHTAHYIWIVDDSKLVDQLGAFPLPVEVVKFGAGHLFRYFEQLDYRPSWRLTADGKRFVTDQENFIIDLHLEKIIAPDILAKQLSTRVGVVEHGLFLGEADEVIIGSADGTTKILKK